ncbi:ribosome maturation factor RimP [Sporohalobacter salinus]|uniref:ribosome maturation factor RimP n=1 Tax=Sporohalobacter salinus TaxID=1494606 RepID=UPI00195F6577|nr:ribosome maturation factor RimP [Sporohalobacter salinus]MBM7623478.1 ribosome maturation factor RimP [Sporohalobacter salinus]
MGQKIEDYIFDLAQPIVENHGLELVDTEYQKEGQNWILRIFVDKAEGITLDDCQEISQEVSAQLDIEDPIEKSYILEVSSPGLDRPLKEKDDFKKFTGHLIDVSTYAPVNGEKSFTGELLEIIDNKIKLKLDNDDVIEIDRDKIAKANLALEF